MAEPGSTNPEVEDKKEVTKDSSPKVESSSSSEKAEDRSKQSEAEKSKKEVDTSPKKETQEAPVDGVFAIEAIEPEQPKNSPDKPAKEKIKTAEKEAAKKDLEDSEKKGEAAKPSKITEGANIVKPALNEPLPSKPIPSNKMPPVPKTEITEKTEIESPAPPTFVEGELVSVGQIGLLPWDNRFGTQIGIERLGEIYYGSVNVGINHRFLVNGEPLRFTIGVPLRFELLDARPNQRFDNLGRFRQQDWDEASDFAKVIQRLQYGSKEQRFFLDINRFSAHNLGHGLLMKRYDANLNLNTSRVGVQFDAFSDYIGFESMLNDITRPNVMGALVFIKPLSIIDRSNYLLRSFSIGLTAVTDFKAPVRNALDREDLDNDGRRETELQVDQKTFQPISLTSPVNGYGLDAEIKLFDQRELDLKTYFDLSFLEAGLPEGNEESVDENIVGSRRVRSSGFAWGQLIRSNLGIDPVHALRIRVEYRNFDPNYLPSYFDSLYEIQRFQYIPGGAISDLANATKLQRVFGRDPNGPRVHGGYFEASWRLGDAFAFAFGLELNDQTPDNHGFIHLELPRIGHFQLSTTYHRRNAQNREELFSGKFGSNDIWIFQTRYRTFSWLYNNLSVMTPFGFGPDSVFRSAIQVNLSLEIGFSYGDADDTPKNVKQSTGSTNPASPPPPPPVKKESPKSNTSSASQSATKSDDTKADNESKE